MADFLSRVAERTLGVAPVIQPLTTPMFASGPASVSGSVEDAARPGKLSASMSESSRVQSSVVQEATVSDRAWGEESLPADNPHEALAAARQFLSSSLEGRGETGKELLYSRPD